MLSCRALRRNRTMAAFRLIPSIEEFLQRSNQRREAETHGRSMVAIIAREAADALRDAMASGDATPASAEEASAWMERRVQMTLSDRLAPSLRRVINATGVILHTNL